MKAPGSCAMTLQPTAVSVAGKKEMPEASATWSLCCCVDSIRFCAGRRRLCAAEVNRLLRGCKLYTDMSLFDVPDAPAKLRIIELDAVPLTLADDHVQHRPFFGQTQWRHRPVWFREDGSSGYAHHDASALSIRECWMHQNPEHEETHQHTQLFLHDNRFHLTEKVEHEREARSQASLDSHISARFVTDEP